MDIALGSWFAICIPIAVVISVLVTIYVVSMGIGHIIKGMEKKGVSRLKTNLFSILIWVPIGLTIYAIGRWF